MKRERTPAGGFKIPDAEYYPRLLARILSRTVRNEMGCLIWQGQKIRSRNSRTWYGQYNFRDRTITVHRIVISLTQREAGFREVVMHTCDNGLCCNPAHLKFGTTQENLKDAAAKGSYQYHKSHYHRCKHGHEFSEENTRICKRGFRHCKQCEKDKQKSPEYVAWRREYQRKRRILKREQARVQA
jgi:hypothetical protein